MSSVAIIRALLVAHAPLLVSVPEARIKAGVLPLGTALPAISVMQISGRDRNIVAPVATVRVTDRVQVTVLAPDYLVQKSVMKLVRKACRDQRGTVGGYPAVLVLTDGQGPDGLTADGAGICVQTQDFIVSFSETS